MNEETVTTATVENEKSTVAAQEESGVQSAAETTEQSGNEGEESTVQLTDPTAELRAQNENLTATNTSLNEENAKLKEQIAILSHNIKSDHQSDALLLAKEMMRADSSLDLNQALDQTLEKYPMFRNVTLELGGSTTGAGRDNNGSGFVKGLSDKIY